MTSGISSRTIELASGETIALDFRNAVWPVGITMRPSAGNSMSRKASNGRRPGNKYATPAENDSVTSNFGFGQEAPISFAVFSATGGAGAVDISAFRANDIPVHSSVSDTISANTPPAPSVAVGESLTIPGDDLFSYAKGSLDFTATSATPARATASVDPQTGEITITGVAAGAVNVTVVATSPTESSGAGGSVVISVTVTS